MNINTLKAAILSYTNQEIKNWLKVITGIDKGITYG